MFLLNKYTKCYYNIIAQAQSRVKVDNTYYEKHHIIPKSLGGTNVKSNLVHLTAKEHYICHRLLTKMVIGVAKYKMIEAVAIFSHNKNRTLSYTSSQLNAIRSANAEASSVRNKGNQYWKQRPKASPELCNLRSTNAKLSKWVNNGQEEKFTNNIDQYLVAGYVLGRLPMLEETKTKISITAKSGITDEFRKVVSCLLYTSDAADE